MGKKVYTVSTKRKPDVTKNSDGAEEARRMRLDQDRKRNFYPLRINAQTVIYVPIEKRNEEYAEQYRQRMRRNYL